MHQWKYYCSASYVCPDAILLSLQIIALLKNNQELTLDLAVHTSLTLAYVPENTTQNDRRKSTNELLKLVMGE